MTSADEFVFQDTGEKAKIRKVSPLLVIRLREMFPAPKPPMQEVDYGDGKKLEPNPAHPDYLAAVQAYDVAMESKVRHLLIERGVVLEWTEPRKTALAELRSWWAETYGMPLEEKNDTVAYVSYLAIGSDVGFQELVDAIITRSQPTEKAVEQTLDRLKS